MTDIAIAENDRIARLTVTDINDKTYDFDFVLTKQDDIRVYLNADLLTLTDDYTASGLSVEAGGTVTIDAGVTLAVDDVITIEAYSTISRPNDYQTSGDFKASDVNAELDNIYTILQELRRDVDTSFRQSPTDTTSINLTLPATVANSVIGFNAAADALTTLGTATDIANAQANALTCTTKATEAAASAAAAAASAALASFGDLSTLTTITPHLNDILLLGDDSDGDNNKAATINAVMNVVDAGARTISGDRTFSGSVNVTGGFQINGSDIDAKYGPNQCRVERASATTIKLVRHDGKYITLYNTSTSKWEVVEIPSAGVTFTLTTETANTLWYLVANYDGTNINFTATSTAPAVDATTGRYLVGTGLVVVGMFYTDGGLGNVANDNMVSSYFNRKDRVFEKTLTSSVNTTSTSYVEASTDLRTPILVWDDEPVDITMNAGINANAGSISSYARVDVDGIVTTVLRARYTTRESYNQPIWMCPREVHEGLSEGYHYLTIAYSTTNASYPTTAYPGTSIHATTRG